MPIVVEPESGIPFPFDTNPEEIDEFRERAKIAVNTIKEIIALGGEVEITHEDRAEARKVVSGNAPLKINEKNAGTLVHLEAILSEYDRDLLNASSRLRTYVTNKLLMETIDEDARVRLKALELLGKVSSVGLFSERLEVEVKHRNVDEIDSELNTLIEKYLGPVELVQDTDDELEEVIRKRSLLDIPDEEIGLSPATQDVVQPEPKETLNGSEDLSNPASQ